MNLPEYIKGWLVQEERSIRWLARKAGVSNGFLVRMLQGRHMPSICLLRKLADVMGVSVHTLVDHALEGCGE